MSSNLSQLLVISSRAHHWLPTTLMAFFSLMASGVAFFLPETSDLQVLPESWDDIKALQKVPKKPFFQFDLPSINQMKSIIDL